MDNFIYFESFGKFWISENPKEILSIIVDINEIHVFIALYKTWKISFNKNFDRIEFLSILCHRITLYEDIFVIVCHHPRDQAGKV